MSKIFKIVQEILKKFNHPAANPNIEEDIIELLILKAEGLFDVGSFIQYDHVKHSFSLKREAMFTFREDFDLDHAYEQILQITQNVLYDDDSKQVNLKENCGLVRYLEKKFLENNFNDCYIITDTLQEETKSEFNKYFRKIEYFQDRRVQINAEIIFPISISYKEDWNLSTKEILHGIFILDSIKKFDHYIDIEEIKFLSRCISYIVNANINELADIAFLKLINEFSKFDLPLHDEEDITSHIINTTTEINTVSFLEDKKKIYTLSDAEESIFLALKNFYLQEISPARDNYPTNKSIDIPKSPPHCNLKFASFWIYNNKNNNSRYLIRNKSFIFNDLQYSDINIVDNRTTNNSIHIFYSFMENVFERILQGKSFKELFDIHIIKNIKNQFYDWDSFSAKDGHNLKENDIMVLLPIIPHFQELPTRRDLEKIPISLLALFFDENTYCYYFNQTFLELMSHSIYENFQLSLAKIRRKIRTDILKNITFLFSGSEFYEMAVKIINENLGVEESLIYLINENYDEFELKTLTKFGFPNKINLDPNIGSFENEKLQDFLNYIVNKTKDENFSDQFIYPEGDSFINKSLRELKYSCKAYADNEIHSLLVIPIKFSDKRIIGYIVCINNTTKIIPSKTKTNSTRVRSFFSKEEIEIMEISAQIIGQCTELINHANRSKTSLFKLRHELPAIASLLIQNLRSMGEETDQYFYNKNHLINIINELEGEAEIIHTFSEYVYIENLDEYLFKQPKIQINLINHFKAVLKIFRKDAQKKGIALKLKYIDHSKSQNTVTVNKLFPLAIFNLIRNAIQYSYFGTNVLIKIIPQNDLFTIKIENIGIPIKDTDMERIMVQGFRTTEARELIPTGTGLGLNLANKIVSVEQGKIDLERKLFFTNRNIFALFCLNKILQEFNTLDEKREFLNKNLEAFDDESLDIIIRSLSLNSEEFEKLDYKKKDWDNNYCDYRITYIEEIQMVKDYLEKRFEYGESINDIIIKDINKKMSLISFKIIIPKSRS
jgi:hypothetical protein